MRYNVYIVHFSYKIKGGAEYLSLMIYRALSKYYDTKIITLSQTDRDELRNLYNVDINPNDIIRLNTIEEDKFTNNVQRLRLLRYLLYLDKLYNEIIYIINDGISIDTYSNILTSKIDLTYIHFPYLYYQIMSNRILTFNPYKLLLRTILSNKFNKSKFIITNSTWTGKVIYRLFGLYPYVLHPPVLNLDHVNTEQVNDFLDQKENIVLTVSRISPEKKLEKILDIAKKNPHLKFYIVGTLAHSNKNYYNLLTSLKPDNVSIFVNIGRDELVNLYKKAKYYVHPPMQEHFGISVLEAVSFLAIPFVYYDSGSCTDIVSHIDRNLCYTNLDEIKQKLEYANSNYIKIISNMQKIINEFSFDKFEKRLTNLIDYIIKIKMG